MIFEKKLIHGHLIKRYKRFLADVELNDSRKVTAHCTNTGSMKTCLKEGAEVFLSPAADPNRKTKYTWEMIKINGDWVGINTSVPNKLAFEALTNNLIFGLRGYTKFNREVKFGNSRIDLFAENEQEKCFIEVKNVTMKVGKYARFPDAKTDRGRKHLNELMQIRRQGMRAVMLYIIQRMDVGIFGPAWDIDPAYAETLLKAFQTGVEIIPVMANVSPEKIELGRVLPFDLLRGQ
ncbi:MAG: sugar fermentation stimulation protein SfsA [Bacteroidetes bacterium 4484_276]|nr:MAG: sugar fermentation stimulation protein SfsA [Bacteroidetes bacterium 4484_276]